MPVYTEVWDESKPQGSRDLSLGDDDIREFKRAIRERLAEDHEFDDDESGNDNIGYHKKVTFTKRTLGNPTSVNDAFILFSKDAGSDAIELYGIDDDGNVIQFTKQGKIMGLGGDAWRTGDKIVSSNTDIPGGWTDISATYTDHFIRISSGTPLTTGGANTHDHGAATGSESAHTHTFSGTTAEQGTYTHAAGNSDGSGRLNDKGHHTHTFSGTTAAGSAHSHSIASANNVPVYVQLKMYSKV